ncbi:glycosyltransferase family 2 protein [Cnuibacter physcomitrellae]|uniref:glycosyltransferase family 2 protein n=1 Tax=Cnuibacter physcomitrellae TaxID=1619308 RepID=UPI0021759FF3|nr:glycosyltransferase family A protein [Cnuibacter physcomitrellae]MCS5496236.1 glycosyltransferase family 2 protein [Cnuibacter physcomitrellae]
MPKLSVVIPAYQNEAFIAAAVESVLDQDHPDFELVVADHSSTDATRRILERYLGDPRFTLLDTPTGGGAEANWRRVSAAASGELLKLLPGDDVLYPGALRAHTEALDEHPSVVLVSSPRDILDAAGRVTIRNRGLQGVARRVQPGVEAVRQTVRRGTNVFGEPGSVTMRRAVLEEAGGWDARFPYLIDQKTYSAVLFRGDYLPVDRTLGGFRVNQGQWSVVLANEQAAQAKAYHHWCRASAPDRISASDVWIGDRRAELMALARRAYYTVNGRRMRSA